MRIGIDARFYGSVGKGLGRYAQKLIENLEKIDRENQYFIFLLKENFEEYQPKNKNFHKILADYRWYTFSEQIDMPKILNRYDLDLVHFPHFNVPFFYRKKFVITIHDLILLHFPTFKNTRLNPFFYWIKYLAYKFIIGSAIRRSKKIITVSKFSQKDILENYPFLKDFKVAVTYEACDFPQFFENKKEQRITILNKYGIIKPYILYVGNAYPHKNLERLLEAWNLLVSEKTQKKEDIGQLVLVGKRDYFYEKLSYRIKRDKIKNVILTGFVQDDDLSSIYQGSTAYIFPSLYEGFGLPPLEAMTMGVPVISNQHGCMREILGKSAYYFDGSDKESIAKAIKKILTDDALRKKLIVAGYQRIKKYDWKKMGAQTLEIYKNV